MEYIFKYITHVHFYFKKYNVAANLDALNNVVSVNEPSSEMLTSQSRKLQWAKSQDLSRSLEIKAIWISSTDFFFFFNKTFTYITLKCAVKHRFVDSRSDMFLTWISVTIEIKALLDPKSSLFCRSVMQLSKSCRWWFSYCFQSSRYI